MEGHWHCTDRCEEDGSYPQLWIKKEDGAHFVWIDRVLRQLEESGNSLVLPEKGFILSVKEESLQYGGDSYWHGGRTYRIAPANALQLIHETIGCGVGEPVVRRAKLLVKAGLSVSRLRVDSISMHTRNPGGHFGGIQMGLSSEGGKTLDGGAGCFRGPGCEKLRDEAIALGWIRVKGCEVHRDCYEMLSYTLKNVQ